MARVWENRYSHTPMMEVKTSAAFLADNFLWSKNLTLPTYTDEIIRQMCKKCMYKDYNDNNKFQKKKKKKDVKLLCIHTTDYYTAI